MTSQSKVKLQLKKEKIEHVDPHKDFLLDINDRCDSCGAQAFVWVKGNSGDLMFCGHHYNKIMDNADSAVAMMEFATETIDERERLAIYERQRTAV